MSNGASISTSAGGAPEPARIGSAAGQVALRLLLPTLPVDLALARQALAGLADELDVDPACAAELRVAITEACTDAVARSGGLHDGPIEVAMAIERDHLVLTVSLVAREPLFPHGTVLVFRPGRHVGAVLSRVVALAAARADLSIDRLSDAQMATDAIAVRAGAHVLDGKLCVGVDEHRRGFELLVGPFGRGGGRRLLDDTALPGVGCLLSRLTDRLDVEPAGVDGGAELLRAGFGVRPTASEARHRSFVFDR